MAGGFDGVCEGPDEGLVGVEGGERGDVFGKGAACDGGDGAVEEGGGDEEFLHGGDAADRVQVAHVEFA